MGNHYHLVVETVEGNLSRGMRQLNGEFTRRFNFRNATVGHLFQGRYHAILVQRQSYLLELSRYVMLNPVRAGMAAGPEAWPWSSYTMTCSEMPAPEWLETDWLLSQFGAKRSEAVHAFREFVAAGLGRPSPLANTRHNLVLGDDDFVRRLHGGEALVHNTETTRSQKKGVALALHEYRRSFESPKHAMASAYLDGAYTMAEVAAHFGVHYRTVSRAVRAFEEAKLSECQTSYLDHVDSAEVTISSESAGQAAAGQTLGP
jgi:transposase-like protein